MTGKLGDSGRILTFTCTARIRAIIWVQNLTEVQQKIEAFVFLSWVLPITTGVP